MKYTHVPALEPFTGSFRICAALWKHLKAHSHDCITVSHSTSEPQRELQAQGLQASVSRCDELHAGDLSVGVTEYCDKFTSLGQRKKMFSKRMREDDKLKKKPTTKKQKEGGRKGEG